jgi:signal transduction histidine kinase
MPKQKKSEPERISKNTLITLINSVSEGVIALRKDLSVSIYNGATLNIINLNVISPETKINQLLKLIDQQNNPVDINKIIQETSSTETYRNFRLLYPDDEPMINLYLNISTIKANFNDKLAIAYVILIRDITQEKSLEEERDEFISVVSHELRTPIAISEGNISNALFIADKTKDIGAIKQALSNAHSQILYLADMVNDLSTLSRADRDILKLDCTKINVVSLIDELYKNYYPEIIAKKIKFIKELSPEIRLLNTSELYLKEILQNFITNAIKYTYSGFISIGAKPYPDGIIFEVTDSGIGISKNDQKKVFDKFFRSEDYRTKQTMGTGLGLYVTKKLITLIGAEVQIESTLNHGSTFRLKVPNL